MFSFTLWHSGSDEGIAKELSELNGGDDVRPPLPVIREALYDDTMLYGYFSFQIFLLRDFS